VFRVKQSHKRCGLVDHVLRIGREGLVTIRKSLLPGGRGGGGGKLNSLIRCLSISPVFLEPKVTVGERERRA
jgi:hypothetical protein